MYKKLHNILSLKDLSLISKKNSMKKFCISLIAFYFPIFINAQSASFNITYTGFTPQAQVAFQYASKIWENTITSAVPIKVLVHFQPLPSSMLAITFPNGRINFTNAPIANTWYSTSLANSIAGMELNPGEMDIEMYVNSTTIWNFDTTGIVPSGQYDLVTVALHELCHGIGFLSLAKKTGTTGSFGLLQASDFAPLTTTFPWPNLDTLPSVFDRFLVTNLNYQLDTFPNPSTTLGTKLSSSTIYYLGANAVAANGGIKPRIYAPTTFALGSSITHLNEISYPAGNVNELMTPNGTPSAANHNPGPICIGVLKDIGWIINPNYFSVHELENNENSFSIYPNPSHDNIFFSSSILKEKIKSIELKNILGEKVMAIGNNSTTKISNLPDGIYFIHLITNDFQVVKKFVKD